MTIPVKVRIFYPADPAGIVPGGVDTFIRGLIDFSPEDIQFSLVGMTTDVQARPPLRWTRCSLARNQFDFYPVLFVRHPGRRSKIPLSLKYTVAVGLRACKLKNGLDVFEFHRIEPALLFRGDPRPKNAFFHNNMVAIRDPNTDILWKYAPSIYDAFERSMINGFSTMWSVRADAVETLRSRLDSKRANINFVPTWVDTKCFSPLAGDARRESRHRLMVSHEVDPEADWVVSVGRLDSQKNLRLLISAFAGLVSHNLNVNLLIIGDGVLRETLELNVRKAGLEDRVRFLGLRGTSEIAEILASADLFALSSAYEGMPMAVLEALASGLPVATTDVGEIRRVVHPGVNGSIAADHSVEAFVTCLKDVLEHKEQYRGEPAVRSIQDFHPANVLRPVYDNYRSLANRHKSNLAK